MSLSLFILNNNIQAGDALYIAQSAMGLLDHHLIYLGIHGAQYAFLANYADGTRVIKFDGHGSFTGSEPQVRRFMGNAIQRQAALLRALSQRDPSSYYLILNNCERSHVPMTIKTTDKQPAMAIGAGVAIAGLTLAAASKSDTGKGIGATMAILGLLAMLVDTESN